MSTFKINKYYICIVLFFKINNLYNFNEIMIEVLIYYIHIAGALYAYTKSWQNGTVKDGVMAVLMIGLFFAIGWALTGTVARIVYPDALNSIYFTDDTFSLVILLIPEIYFFYHFFIKTRTLSGQ